MSTTLKVRFSSRPVFGVPSASSMLLGRPGPKGDTGNTGPAGPAGPNTVTTSTTTNLTGYLKGDGANVGVQVTPIPAADLPIASAGSLGAVRVGSNLSIDGDGILSGLVSTTSESLDEAFGATRGSILVRTGVGWELLTPGTNGHVLTSQGSGADPIYAEIVSGFTSPDAFTFTTTNDATPSTLTTSNTVTLAGGTTVNDTWIVTVSASSGSPQARVNGGSWSNTRGEMALVCRSGDTLQLRVTSAASLGQVVVTVRVGGYSTTWTVNSAAWSPSLLPGIAPSLSIALQLSNNLLWQDAGKTTLATAHGHPVRVATCPWTGLDYTFPSDSSRPTLYDEGSGKWSLAWDGVDDYCVSGSSFALQVAGFTARLLSSKNHRVFVNQADVHEFFVGGDWAIAANGTSTRLDGATASVWPSDLASHYVVREFGSPGASGTLTVGAFLGGAFNQSVHGRISGFITTASAISGSDRTLLETYLASL